MEPMAKPWAYTEMIEPRGAKNELSHSLCPASDAPYGLHLCKPIPKEKHYH